MEKEIPMTDVKERNANIAVDLGYGDSGKGTLTDYFCSPEARRLFAATLVVRFNGGSQAAHAVTRPDGRRHVFSQFGSGTFNPGVRTLLSRHMLVSPLAMLSEERALQGLGITDGFERTVLSEEALVITPFHRAANRLREMSRGADRHGSCGHGIGETVSHSLRFPEEALRLKHLRNPKLRQRLERIRETKREDLKDVLSGCRGMEAAKEELAYFDDPSTVGVWMYLLKPFLAKADIRFEDELRAEVANHQHVVFEGAQGVLLDEWHGFHPYTTWSTCTFRNALDLLTDYGWDGAIKKTGVIRGYATRHGAGPFPTDDPDMARALPDADNVMNDWQHGFRVGWLDLVAVRYAIKACGGIDSLALTCLDRLSPFGEWQVCDSYETPRGPVRDLEVGGHHDRANQERLTALLLQATPKFVRTAATREDRIKPLLHAFGVANLLGDPAKSLLLSTGPTWRDKKFV
jgi:adenylosuccinate synthase